VKRDVFAPAARRDLSEAASWLARTSPEAAEAFIAAVVRGAKLVRERPLIGRERPELLPTLYRFWRVSRFPYVLAYNAERRPPLIVRVLHMARDLSAVLADLDET